MSEAKARPVRHGAGRAWRGARRGSTKRRSTPPAKCSPAPAGSPSMAAAARRCRSRASRCGCSISACRSSVVGDMTTPALGKGDVFLVTSGPGETSTVLALMKVAKQAGARNLLLTAEPQASAAQAGGFHAASFPAQTMASDQGAQGHVGAADGLALRRRAVHALRDHGAQAEDHAGHCARGDAGAAHQSGIGDALRTHAAAPDPRGDRRELAGRAAARRARISRRAHGGRHGHAGGRQDARTRREGDRPRHPAALLLWRGELRGRAAGGQRLGAGRTAARWRRSPRRCSSACSGSASATSMRSSTTRPRISPPACRPISPSSRPAGRRSSASSKGRAAKAGGATRRWPTYYAEHAAGNNPFNWVQVHPLMTPEIIARVPVRPCRPGRDVADDGALPRGGRHAAVRRKQGLVHGERQGCVGRAWRQGTRHDPRASQGDSEGVTLARVRRAGGRAHSARRRTT